MTENSSSNKRGKSNNYDETVKTQHDDTSVANNVETKLTELDKLLKGFETGDLSLEESIAKYKIARNLIAEIKAELNQIDLQINEIRIKKVE